MENISGARPRQWIRMRFFTWLLLALFLWLLLPQLLESISRPLERKRKYAEAIQRVEKAGGWTNIQAAARQFFLENHPSEGFDKMYFSMMGQRENTNALPSALETLQPRRIQYYADGRGICELRLKLYGIHRTGTYSEPYYGIWVICTNVPPDYIPAPQGDEAGMTKKIERKGDGIFEVR